jgi:peptidylprolyl isomerase
MRRAYALIAVVLIAAIGVIAGCSSTSTPADANKSVSVTGAFGATPKVTIPAQTASSTLYTKTVIKGKGATIPSGGLFYGSTATYIWDGKTHKLAGSSYTTHQEQVLGGGSMLPGLMTALKNTTVGSRVLAVVPPKDGLGSSGDPQEGITGTDTLVFVIDVQKAIPGTATGKQVSTGGGSLPTVGTTVGKDGPTITIPKGGTPSSKLTSTTLIQGTGAKVAENDEIFVQYEGVIWRTGKVFDSSWSRHQPFETILTDSQQAQEEGAGVIPGWVTGLTGKTVGSRVLLTIPPKDGYGSSGSSQAGIKGTDTLVFVVDILAAVGPSS